MLLRAMKTEFSRAPLNEASIANIVKLAGISRGSFYQYFKDKEDAYFFLLEVYTKQNQQFFIKHLRKSKGDVFDTFIAMFHWTLENFKNKENRGFFEHTFLNMNYKIEHAFAENFTDETFHHKIEEINHFVNKENLNIEGEHEFIHVFKILMAVTLNNTIQYFAKKLSLDESLHHYTTEIQILKRGLSKQEMK